MITLIEALNYRCLRYLRQPLGAFQVLVGPNASGKTSFLDVPAILSEILSLGLRPAVERRSSNYYDLIWGREGDCFELAVEAKVPEPYRTAEADAVFDTIRYEIRVGGHPSDGQLGILEEQIHLICDAQRPAATTSETDAPSTLFLPTRVPGCRSLLEARQTRSGIYVADPEQAHDDKGPISAAVETVLSRRPGESVLRRVFVPDFPASDWLAKLLANRVHYVDLAGDVLRRPAPPGVTPTLAEGGVGLPRMVASLQKRPQDYDDWIKHLQTALPTLSDVRVITREEDRHSYVMLRHKNGLEVPSMMLSQGTLRVMALTAMVYLGVKSEDSVVYCIEEPENSLHPTNIETVMESLQSAWEGQVLVATHSPIVVSLAKPKDILIFSADSQRGTQILRGDEHPYLRNWHREVGLGTIFASGVLGS